MRLLLGLLAYLVTAVAIGSGAVAILFSAPEPSAERRRRGKKPPPRHRPAIQAWLERKAEGVAFAEKEKAAGLADREWADALRAKLAATPEPLCAPHRATTGKDGPPNVSAPREPRNTRGRKPGGGFASWNPERLMATPGSLGGRRTPTSS